MALAHWLPVLANHLWQSTAFAAVAWLATLALRKHQARVRFWIWLTASLKFLVPFSLLIALGVYMRPAQTTAIMQPAVTAAVTQIATPFFDAESNASGSAASHASNARPWPVILAAIWAAGFMGVSAAWWRKWRRVRAIARTARSGAGEFVCFGEARVPVATTSALLEPGVFGILRPVLLLPEGIREKLSAAQMEAIIAHEMCHVRRWDNLTAAIHMFVEAVFWFHPAVWWIGRQMVEEREHACDEEVLQLGGDPECYAEGILHVCKMYAESPVACVSGVSGADLKARIVRIMTGSFAEKLTSRAKAALGAIAVAMILLPIAAGLLGAVHGQAARLPTKRERILFAVFGAASRAQDAQGPLPSFEVVSVKPHPADPSGRMMVRMGNPPGDVSRWSATNVTARNLVGTAFDVKDFQMSGGPNWMNSDRFDVEAKLEDSMAARMQKMTGPEQQKQFHLMLQSMLADRFKLQITRVTKETSVLALVVAKGGPKLKEVPPPEPQATPPPPLAVTAGGALPTPAPGQSFMMMRDGLATLSANAQPITGLLNQLSGMLGRQVVDQTGLKGLYQYTLQFAPPTTTAMMPPSPGGGDASPDSSATSIFTALQEQLGLRLDTTKAPVDTITIEHIEQPSEN